MNAATFLLLTKIKKFSILSFSEIIKERKIIMASNKKNYKRPEVDTKALAEKKQKAKKNISRIVALALAGVMVLGIAISAIASSL